MNLATSAHYSNPNSRKRIYILKERGKRDFLWFVYRANPFLAVFSPVQHNSVETIFLRTRKSNIRSCTIFFHLPVIQLTLSSRDLSMHTKTETLTAKPVYSSFAVKTLSHWPMADKIWEKRTKYCLMSKEDSNFQCNKLGIITTISPVLKEWLNNDTTWQWY